MTGSLWPTGRPSRHRDKGGLNTCPECGGTAVDRRVYGQGQVELECEEGHVWDPMQPRSGGPTQGKTTCVLCGAVDGDIGVCEDCRGLAGLPGEGQSDD